MYVLDSNIRSSPKVYDVQVWVDELSAFAWWSSQSSPLIEKLSNSESFDTHSITSMEEETESCYVLPYVQNN
jgi:hypothetical protein